MDPLSPRDIRTASLAEKTESNLTSQTEPGSNPDNHPFKYSIQNPIFRASTTYSTRSDSPSTVDSVFSAVHSAASSALFEEFFESELQAAGQCEPSSDDDDDDHTSNVPRISNPRHPFNTEDRSFDPSAYPSAADPAKGEPKNLANDASRSKHEDVDSELEDDDFGCSDDDEDDDDDEWSGEPDRIEAAVLANVDDLGFAAWLIMKLHRDQVHSQAQRIGGWQKEVINCQRSPQPGDSSYQQYGNSHGNQQSSKSRKRPRLSEHRGRGSDDGDEEERDEGEGNRSPEDRDEGPASGEPKGTYACPFNKSDPTRFCVNATTGNQFRVCESGCKTIQRLKEHIKRRHLLIQCDRCSKNFSSNGRTVEASVAELRRHRQQPESCPLVDPQANLGISMEHWTLLDRSGGKKRQKMSEVDKWFDIWDTIYPTKDHPEHPWAERTTPGIRRRPASDHTQNLFSFLDSGFDRLIESGDIQFPEGQESEMKARILSHIQSMYEVYMSLNGTPSLVNTSSSGQTATQVAIPTTPVLENRNMRNAMPGQIPGPKANRDGTQPLLLPSPRTSPPMNPHSQPAFGMLQPQIPANMAYGAQNFSGYGANQLPGVSAAPVSGPPQALPLDQQSFNYFFEDMNNGWSGFQYPLHADPDSHEMAYIQNEHNEGL
ncbi:hypothetical protein F4677DRAFT_283079 [Hypoxylon crocopeplum]|nr:hypothetical protein F4677DRAFT_283079 [Hypoxylon crocopeplum]